MVVREAWGRTQGPSPRSKNYYKNSLTISCLVCNIPIGVILITDKTRHSRVLNFFTSDVSAFRQKNKTGENYLNIISGSEGDEEGF
jgi:hypothetical protein